MYRKWSCFAARLLVFLADAKHARLFAMDAMDRGVTWPLPNHSTQGIDFPAEEKLFPIGSTTPDALRSNAAQQC